jgi:hypothetical protein
LTSKAALEGERKQVTVLFADLKGSMELIADRDPVGRGGSCGSELTRSSFPWGTLQVAQAWTPT